MPHSIATQIFEAWGLILLRKIKRNLFRLKDIKSLYKDWRCISLIRKSEFYDAAWYVENYIDVKSANLDPAIHYYMNGALEGRDPSPKFNTLTYLHLNPDVKSSGFNPLVHYLLYGAAENRKIKVQITATTPTTVETEFFDAAWYQEKYAASMKNGESPLDHYNSVGWKLGFDPSERFSTLGYLDFYRDIKSAGINPLAHYLSAGRVEGRMPKPPSRIHNSPFARLTPDEVGTPDILLDYDAPVKPVAGIQHERIAVHLHLYHTDMCDDFIRYLSNIRQSFTLLISVMADVDAESVRKLFSSALPSANKVIVKALENRGRDVAPWVVWFRDEILCSTIFLHVHTKKSLHNKSHGGWFRYLNHITIGSPSTVNQILQSFVSDPKIGIIAPCYHWSLANQPNYGKNRSVCEEFFSRLSDDELPGICQDYPAGSFFWARTAALKPLLDIDIDITDFPEEEGQLDGTIAHAIERVIGLLPSLSGMTYKKATVNVAYDLIRYFEDNRVDAPEPVWKSRYPTTQKTYRTKSDKIAVYSCLSGDYEQVIPLIDEDQSIDKFLIVDNHNAPVPEGYTKIVSNYVNPESVRTARFAKTHPHIWFGDYDFVFWIDSNIQFLGDLRNYTQMLKAAKADCGFILHPVRGNLVEESAVLSASRIVDHEMATQQITRYLSDPSLLSEPLFETNFMVSRPSSKTVQKFMGAWWSELNKFTHRDQLSVNYAARAANLKWVHLLEPGRSARDHQDFILFSHNNTHRENIISTIKNSL